MSILEHDRLPTTRRRLPGVEALSQADADMLEFRRKFVIRMGWVKEPYPDDSDRYDDTPSTIHFNRWHESGEVLSGMRLTPLLSLDESLSVEMLATNPVMQRQALEFGQAIDMDETDVWDLTRLVNRFRDESLHYESLLSMLEVFGAGLAKTYPEDEKSLVWLFTTTDEMKGHLDNAGIQASTIVRGKIKKEDELDSYFCVIRPIDAMQFLRDNQAKYGFTYRQVDEGLQSVR